MIINSVLYLYSTCRFKLTALTKLIWRESTAGRQHERKPREALFTKLCDVGDTRMNLVSESSAQCCVRSADDPLLRPFPRPIRRPTPPPAALSLLPLPLRSPRRHQRANPHQRLHPHQHPHQHPHLRHDKEGRSARSFASSRPSSDPTSVSSTSTAVLSTAPGSTPELR